MAPSLLQQRGATYDDAEYDELMSDIEEDEAAVVEQVHQGNIAEDEIDELMSEHEETVKQEKIKKAPRFYRIVRSLASPIRLMFQTTEEPNTRCLPTCEHRFQWAMKTGTEDKAPTSEQGIDCPTCDKHISNGGNLMGHRKLHNVAMRTEYKCPKCLRTYTEKAYFDRHQASKTACGDKKTGRKRSKYEQE